MTQRQIELIGDTWDFILENTDEVGALFYNKLFQLDPALKQLFRESIAAQSKKLVAMITFLVAKLGKLDEVKQDVKALGARHGGYHVKPQHYATVGDALLHTLEQGLGDRWNNEVKEAWLTMYVTLSQIMINSMNDKKSMMS